MQDYAMGRAIVSEIFNASVGLAAVPLIHADENRYSLTITTDGAAIVYIGNTPDVTAATGFPLKVGDHPLQLCVEEHGQWVMEGLWVIGGAAGPTHVSVLSASFEMELFKQYSDIMEKQYK